MEITKGKFIKPYKVCIYGPEGIGKSTLASMFPDPVFIDTEGSTDRMDVARLPKPSSWQGILEAVRYVKSNPTCCKTLVIDTADWAEKFCSEHICATRKVSGIEDFGYGKGYTYLKEEFGKLLNELTDLRELGIHVVITAHAQMRKFEQPDELGAYDRWELKLSKQCAPLVKEWADMILFCNYKTMVVNVDNQGAQKGKNKAQGGRRVMYTQHHPCWDAKNRDGLPEEVDMDYEVIRPLIESNTPSGKTAQTIQTPPPVTKAEPAPVQNSIYPEPKENQQMDIMDYQKSINMPIEEVPEEVPDKSPMEEASKGIPVSRYLSNPANIPQALKDLMEQNDVTEPEISDAAFSKGYYPENTLIENMDAEFVSGWCVGFWPQVFELIKTIRANNAVPFN